MCEHHRDIRYSQSFPAPLKALEEEKAVVGIQVGSVPVVQQITVHENLLSVSKNVVMPVQPSRFLHQVKHCNEFLLENPEQLKFIT